MRQGRATFAPFLLGVAACATGVSSDTDPPHVDARVGGDAVASGHIDAHDPGDDAPAPVIDAAEPDAAMFDAPLPDAPLPDAPLPDAPPADAPLIDAPPPDAPVDAGTVGGVLYANDETTLYKIDPATYAASLVGSFGWPSGTDAMADIAIGPDGRIFGASSTKLYVVNAATAKCTSVGSLSKGLNALTFVPVGVVDPSVEALVGASSDGTFYRVNPDTGALTQLGHFSSGHSSSGDLAYASGPGIVAAVNPGGANDLLAKVAPATGATTGIGAASMPWLWGLAYVNGKLVGFTLQKDIVTINPATGAVTHVGTGPIGFYGAAGR
jgi:hypothetical protein